MDEKKVIYSRSDILPGEDKNNPLLGAMGVFEGFADKVRIKRVKVKDETKVITEYELTTILSDSVVKHYFGDECVNEKHSLKIRATYWGEKAAESARKYTPTKSQIIRVFIKNMKLEIWTGRDQIKRYVVNGTGAQFAIVHQMSKPRKEDWNGNTIPSILEDETCNNTDSESAGQPKAPVMVSETGIWDSFDADDGGSPWD